MRNYFVLDGVDSRDFGVYISGKGTFSAPARSYDMISIPGRSGDLYKDNNRLENGVLTYPAFICRNFKQNIADFRAFLLSLRGYHRLVDSYHPNEYRMVSFQGEFAPDVTAKNDAASFDITFNCKPQRFLLSGEEVVTLDVNDPPSETFSGNPATFETDGEYPITDLTVDIEPVQDLNGYDSPWPAGGGKNLYNANALNTLSSSGITATVSNGTITLNGTATANAFFTVIGTGLTSGEYAFSFNNPVTSSDVHVSFRDSEGHYFSDTRADAVNKSTSFTGGPIDILLYVASGATVTNFVVKPQLETGSTPTAWSPYSNICPISGWTGATVTRTGKNLFPLGLTETAKSGVVVSSVDGGYKCCATSGSSYIWARFQIADASKFAGKSLTIKGEATASNTQNPIIQIQYRNKSDVRIAYVDAASGQSATLNVPNDADGSIAVQLYLTSSVVATVGWETTWTNIQLELGSTASAYEPFSGTTYSITFPSSAGTVYGGTLDVTSGKLTVDRAMADLGAETWTRQAIGNTYRFVLSGFHTLSGAKTTGGYDSATLCSMYPSNSAPIGSNNVDDCYAVYNGVVLVRDDSYNTADAFKTAMSGVQLVYELATPIVYDLTPTEVSTLLGTNNVWSDTGAVEGKYVLPFTIENPTRFNSQPLLRVYGAGNLGINGDTITISQADVYTDIDCEMMDAYKGAENRNQYITLANYKFPVLVPGENNFSLGSGITRVEITPRWWTV